MKQTLLILSLLAAGVASAATGDLLFSSMETYTTDGIELTKIDLPAKDAPGAVTMAKGFTLTFDLTYTSPNQGWASLLGFGETTSNSYHLDYGSANGQWQFLALGSYKAGNYDNPVMFKPNSTEPSHCAIVMTPGQRYTEDAGLLLQSTLSFYIDGRLIATADVGAPNYGEDQTGVADALWLGGRPNSASGRYTAASFSNIKIYEGAYMAAVPEPATATLSLLALAGLAARRRRK